MYYRVNGNVKIIENYKGASIIQIKNDRIMTKDCNKTGLYILKLCNGEHSMLDIIKNIENDYEKLNSRQIDSISEFLNEHIADGIINVLKEKELGEINIVGRPDIVVPTNVSMELTNLCQLKCIHCFNSSGRARENELSIDKFIEIANFFVDIGTSTFFITGGEPLLKKNVEQLLDFLGNHATYVTLATNGMVLKEKTLEILSKYPNIGVQISLDGLEKNHDFIRGVKGAFQQTISNIQRFTSRHIPVSISYTMNDYNKDDLDGLIKLCREINCIGVSIGLTSNAGRAKENRIPVKIAREFAEILAESHHKYTTDDFQVGLDICEKKINVMIESVDLPNKCGAGYQEIHIMSNGKVTPCPAIPNMILGDVTKQSLFEIIRIENIQNIMHVPSPIRSLCGDCQNYDTCGNCIASMLEVDESECKIQREFIQL